MPSKIGHYIDGQTIATGQNSGPVMNPATGEAIGSVCLASPEEVEYALAAAAKALPSWAQLSPLKRARVMFRFKELIERDLDRLAQVISLEHGKVLSDAKAEVVRGMEVVEFACGIPHLLKGSFSQNVGTGVDSWSMLQPVGICVGISPFNFPAMVPMWMFPIALACGNTFVMKPSERDPSVVVELARLLEEAGLPPGVFNVLHGDKGCVEALLQDPRVAAVSFVGSTPVAQAIYAQACANGKRVQALGGAKNHMVVMEDADLELACSALMGAAYGAAGERCMAISVAVAVGNVADALVSRLKPLVANLKIGPGQGVEPENDMGPLVTKSHLAKVKGYVDLGVAEGAELVVDGRQRSFAGSGYFIGGSLFDRVTKDMRIYQEEIFGPVLAVVRASDLSEALQLIRDHEYGNGAAIFTRDGEVGRAFAHHVTAGMVGINVPIPVPMAFHSFGGWKRSNFGPLNMHGMDGVRFYTRMKTVTSRWPTSEKTSLDPSFSMPTL